MGGDDAFWNSKAALALRQRVAGFGDIAVLVRNSEVMAAFAAAFDEAGIPYLVGRGRGFYEAREITDLSTCLRVLVNPRDEISMAAVLRSPLVGVSDEALLRLKQSGNLGAAVRRLEMNAHDPVDLAKLERFRAGLRDWRAIKDYAAFDRLCSARHGRRRLCARSRQPRRGERGKIPGHRARGVDHARRLAEFVDELELVRAADPRDTDAPPEDSANAVRMLTVHAAKGLEFPIVFLAAIHKGMDTNLGRSLVLAARRLGRALAQSGHRRREGRSVPARHPAGAETARDRRRQPAVLCRHDARRGAPGALVFAH